jgi:hypothetical protein
MHLARKLNERRLDELIDWVVCTPEKSAHLGCQQEKRCVLVWQSLWLLPQACCWRMNRLAR